MFQRKKDSQNTDKYAQERNQFIREQVRPQKKKELLGIWKRFFLLLLSACIFGIVAGGTILFMQQWMGSDDDDFEPSSPTVASSEDVEVRAGKKGFGLHQMNKLSEHMAMVGSNAENAIVGIRSVDGMNWLLGEEIVIAGVIFRESKDAYDIVTMNDIGERENVVEVVFANDVAVEGTVRGYDSNVHLAVIRVMKSALSTAQRKQIAVISFGSAEALTKGTNVVAVGAPNGVLYSVMSGKIVHDKLAASVTDGELKLFSTDLPYFSDGTGMVLDTSGRLVGMISVDYVKVTGESSMAFVDISSIVAAIDILRSRKKIAHIGFEGKSISTVLAEAHGLERGAYVTLVYVGGAAYDSGMRVADVIVKMDGRTVKDMSDIYEILLDHSPGDTIKYTVSRSFNRKNVHKEFTLVLR